MRILLLTLFVFHYFLFCGQLLNNSALYYSDSISQSIQFQGQSYVGSTHLPLSITKVLYNGGYIDTHMKENAAAKLNKLNRVGFESMLNLSYFNFDPIILKKYGFYVNVSSLTSTGVEYTDDFYHATLDGNSSYKGEYINLQQSGFHARFYNSIGAGIMNNKFKLGISYTSIQSEINAQLYEGGITVSPDATTLDANLNGYMTSSNATDNLFNPYSWGMALNFEITNYINKLDSNSNSRIIAGVNGFGIQKLTNASYIYLDTNLTYSGVHIQNITDVNNPLLPSNILDSLNENSSQLNFLPFELFVHKIGGKKSAKIHSCYGLRYRSLSNYSVLLYAGAEYHFNKKITIGSVLSYGGYSSLNHGIYARYKSKKFIAAINTNNFIGLFSKNSLGTGLNLSFCYFIK